MNEQTEYERLIQKVKEHFLKTRGKPPQREHEVVITVEGQEYILTVGDFIILRLGDSSGINPDFKFHINVADEDLADTWAPSAVKCAQKFYCGMKVYSVPSVGDSEQNKKPITVYTKLDQDAEDLLSS